MPPPPPPPPPPSWASFHSTGEQPHAIHINHLPDELLLLIFTNLTDARSLCICNLVSKRFSVLVRQTPSIILTFPHPNSNHRNQNLPNKLFNYLSKSFFWKPRPSKFDGLLFQSTVDSLKRFHNVRNLRIELPSFQQDESIIKWHAEFGRDLNLCLILFATSSNHQIQSPDTLLTNQLQQSRIASANQCFREAIWRHHVLRHVVENHRHTLDAAEICDSSKKGRIVVRGKQQVMDLVDPEVKLPASGYGKLWPVQVLRLPESGRVLQGVTVVAIRRTGENEEEHEDVGVKQLMEEGYEMDEEFLLWEVFGHIFEHHSASRTLNINANANAHAHRR